MKKPPLNSIPEWYRGYIRILPERDLAGCLGYADEQFVQLLSGLSEDECTHAYASGKWTIKDIIQHITDAERVFAYRALRFGRGDDTILSGYDHNEYVGNANASGRTKDSMLEEYRTVRSATESLFSNLTGTQLTYCGQVDNYAFSALGLGYIIAGHQLHHTQIIRMRYLDL